MLTKKERLTKKQFAHFFKRGKRLHGAYVQLVYTPFPTFHGAAVVGKKINPRAVVRNRIRRRLYAALYARTRAKDQTGVFILIAKPAIKTVPYRAICEDLNTLLTRIEK